MSRPILMDGALICKKWGEGREFESREQRFRFLVPNPLASGEALRNLVLEFTFFQ